MNAHISLRELLKLVPEKTTKRVPSAKWLRENCTPVAISDDGLTICYDNGFVCYAAISGETVFHIRKCKSYTYGSVNDKYIKNISEGEMLEFEWYIPAIIYGESRAECNQNKNESNHRYTLKKDENDEEENLDDIIKGDSMAYDPVNEMCACLTERQRTMVILSFVEGYTHNEIAQILGVERTTVTLTIKNALKKIKKTMQFDEF